MIRRPPSSTRTAPLFPDTTLCRSVDGAYFVVRLKAPLDGETTIADQVQGAVTVQNAEIDDFVLLRSDGTPTDMLSVVVDDHDMGITHVIRGDDHLKIGRAHV